MERVEELRQQMKDALDTLHDVRGNKWRLLQHFQNTIMEILVGF